jgi:transglutaminase/protease-like cytokinesis protein 3
MRWLTVIVFLVAVIPAFAQDKDSFSKNNSSHRFDETTTPITLAQQLTLSCTTDLQKVKAIFYWVTDNIAYRTKTVYSRKKPKRMVKESEANDTGALKPLDERVSETVLEERVAVCEGYARLFKTLCHYAGLQAEVVHGYARTEATRRIQRFRPNHSWNAVMIDSVWRLLDVTWASGYITWHGNEFVKQLDEQYFLTAPAQFIREHYPDDMRWTLMDDPPLMPEFRQSPFKQKSFTKYLITIYKPEKGVIEVSPGDTINIELETASAEKDRSIMSDPFLDTTIYTTPVSALLVPVQQDKKIFYTYIVDRPTVRWLYLLYNDDIIMRYKLEVKQTAPVAVNKEG